MQSGSAASIVWFKRDLRTFDHQPLVHAAIRGPIIPLLVIEPELWALPDASYRQFAFMRECAIALDCALQKLGVRLAVRVGRVVDVLADLKQRHDVQALYSHEETGNQWTYERDVAVGDWCRANGVTWHEFPQNGVVRRLKDRNGWAKRWDRLMAEPIASEPARLTGPVLADTGGIPDPAVMGLAFDGCSERQTGGRAVAQDTLNSFLMQRGRNYRRAMSSPLSGAESCSRLSPYLAWGAISIRETTQATWSRQRSLRSERGGAELDWRGSLISFSGRLHWHCHFIQKLESQPSIECVELHPATRGLRPQPGNQAHLQAWAQGQTGFPFVDACMRSLKATGWINFRMRAMLVSFASYNLWLPWQDTGMVLARLFTDYEPGIHWPQMQMQSGTTGIYTIRLYNPVKQGRDQDPSGTFIRRWLPELDHVPDAFLHEPWACHAAERIIGNLYPTRIVDLQASATAAKDRIYGLRRGVGFREAADVIQVRHGSRKSGLPMTGSTRDGPRRRSPSNQQLEFDL